MSLKKPIWMYSAKVDEEKAVSIEDGASEIQKAGERFFLPRRVKKLEEDLANTKRKRDHPVWFEGLKQKHIELRLNQFDLTQKQQDAVSLRFEYNLSKQQVAERMGIHRTTLDEHLRAAERRMRRRR